MIVRFGGETLPILSHFDCTTAPPLTRSVYGRSQLFPRAPMFSMNAFHWKRAVWSHGFLVSPRTLWVGYTHRTSTHHYTPHHY